MAFIFKLELEDGTPTDPPTLDTAAPTRRPGDTIPLARDKILGVIDAGASLFQLSARGACAGRARQVPNVIPIETDLPLHVPPVYQLVDCRQRVFGTLQFLLSYWLTILRQVISFPSRPSQ
jgi:hypothetical protein